ncbi:MAG: hypothetical protein A3A80_03065 [Candidatus Terrybacteria bacterium RIFCSPLOWO2_01_FULL_44_24]|nr:MAG: hypothetical protein A3A80_03065 [Candidatus Terrybacteria bacterium RIFCSPLOWO2_01_FULL_44_24]
MEEKGPKNIIILGGGYGGVRVGLDLGRFLKKHPTIGQEWALFLIDKSDSHVFTPALYEMATVLREDATAWNIKRAVAIEHAQIFSGLPVRYMQDEITAIDTENNTVAFRDEQALKYDILVLATGSKTNFFNIPGLEEYGLPLKVTEDAIRIRNAITEALELKPGNNDPARIIIGGGGATGVELASELTRFIRKKCVRRMRGACRKNEITLFEASPTILNGFPKDVINNSRKRLKKLGIDVQESITIKSLQKNYIDIQPAGRAEEKIPYDVFVWAGGIRISALMEDIISPKDKKGRCLVDPTLEVKLSNTDHQSKHIYALGDLTCLTNPNTQQPMPGTAYIAIEEAKIVAKNIRAEITATDGEIKKVRYSPPAAYPFILPLGGKYAIFIMGKIKVSGFAGWLIRILVDLRYFLTILPWHKAVWFWANSVWLSIKND